MNELLQDTKAVILGLLALLMGLITFLGKRELKRLAAIEANYVTRHELSETLKVLREDQQRMHAENRADMRYIRARVDTIGDRQ